MKLKKKPQPPQRQNNTHKVNIASFNNLSKLLCALPVGISFDEVSIAYEYYNILNLKYKVPESDESFNKRYQKYEKSLKEWEVWYMMNKEAIDKAEKERKAKELKEITKKQEKLEKELRALRDKKSTIENQNEY